ncbi:MAG: T9SS type A sorting domain-containing protein [Bacteroidales bacterium]|nr:T9SS type A sorting domain-containing protein [Bacteroidales bacterium]
MRFNLIVCLLILLSSSYCNTFSQNYQSLNSGRTILYKNSEGTIRVVEPIGSIEETDSVLTSFNVINQISDDCYAPDAGSWIGKQVIIKSNGDNIFFNQNNDSILIKTSATLNQTWQIYHDNSVIILAQVTDVDTLTFCGINDSIKTISFHVLDLDMNPIAHELNYLSIILSKNYGLIRTLNFLYFPENTLTGYEHYSPPLEEYEICGIQSNALCTQNLNYLDVYDFQPGDELHINYYRLTTCCDESTQTILKYLEREDFENRIEYRVEREYFQQLSVYGTPSETYVHDTITEIYEPWAEFDLLPGEIIFNENLAYCFKMIDGEHPLKTPLDKGGIIELSEPDCWSLPVFEGCSTGNYIKKLGGPYFHCETSESITIKELVYYSSGGETWGEPLIISKIEENNLKNKVSIFPNPANNSFSVSGENIYNIELLNSLGQVLLQTESTGKIFIGNQPAGIYFVKINLYDSIIMKKLIKQ